MKVHPAIAKLRSNPASQLCARSHMEAAHRAWAKRDAVSEIARNLSEYAAGQPLAALPALGRLMAVEAHASEVTKALLGSFIAALREQPLGEIPLRHSSSAGFSRLQLMQHGGAVLSLCAYEPLGQANQAAADDADEPQSAHFTDCELHEVVLSGEAKGYFHQLVQGPNGDPKALSKAKTWRRGDCIAPAAKTEARQFVRVDETLLLLQLTRTPDNPAPTREVRLSDAAVMREKSGNRRASEQLMALSVLGALGKPGTINPMRGFALDKAHDPDARWEAVRQILAMDAAGGFSLLSELARRQHDALSSPATSLRDDLSENQPALREAMLEQN